MQQSFYKHLDKLFYSSNIFLLVNELGSGEFGIVWLAEAVGISAFHPRDMLKQKESRSRFSIFNRFEKRNSYVYCKEVTKVAVKGLKGLYILCRVLLYNQI